VHGLSFSAHLITLKRIRKVKSWKTYMTAPYLLVNMQLIKSKKLPTILMYQMLEKSNLDTADAVT
jgi:hypothetical protein